MIEPLYDRHHKLNSWRLSKCHAWDVSMSFIWIMGIAVNWNGAICMVVPRYLIWCIRLGRNNRHLEASEKAISDLKLFFLRSLGLGCSVRFCSFVSVHGLMEFCTLCAWFYCKRELLVLFRLLLHYMNFIVLLLLHYMNFIVNGSC